MCSKKTYAAGILAAVMLLTGCAAPGMGEAKILQSGAQKEEVGTGKSVLAERGTLHREIVSRAEILYTDVSVIRLEADGVQYAETCVSNGDHVKKGDVLMRFTRQNDNLRLRAIEQELEMLDLEEQDRLEDLDDRIQQIRKQQREVDPDFNGDGTHRSRISFELMEREIEKTELQKQQVSLRAKEQRRRLKDEREEIRKADEKLEVTAPADGVVGSVQYMSVGIRCPAGKPLMELYDPDAYLLTVGGTLGSLHMGQTVEITYDAGGTRKTIKGTVTASDDGLEEELKAGRSAIRTEEKAEARQLSGATVTARQIWLEDVLLVSSDAVEYEGGRAYVQVIQDGVIGRRSILTGPRDNENVVVLAGLKEGSRVAVN